MQPARLTGKVALVTGSGRGIGRAVALKLAREGASVVVNDVDAEPAKETQELITEFGGRAEICTGDVVQESFSQRFVSAAIDGFGGLDIIVNNAGYTWDSAIHKMSDEQFRAMLDVHLMAPFRILRAAAEPIRAFAKSEAERGIEVWRKIVNISSVSGTGGNPGQANYAAAKSGVIGLTKTLAKEWGRYKVNVNCVAFGYVQTRLTQPIEEEASAIIHDGHRIPVGIRADGIKMLNRTIPAGRGGRPEEAAGAVFLLCTPESDYVSGQTLVCGGGYGSAA